MTTKPEFSGSLEHANVMFDSLTGLEGRFRVQYFMPGEGLWVKLMLPSWRRSAFTDGQTFYGVGIHDSGISKGCIWWYWAEELFIKGPKIRSDEYGAFLHYDFYSRGEVWCGNNPESLERATTSAA